MIYYDEMACAFLEKNSKNLALKIAKNESGQSMVEYLLVLVVTIILILGLMAQFYRPFNKWMTSYMGPYLECLLDVGELPTFGSSGGGSGLCAAEFKSGNGIYSKTTPIPGTNSGTSSSSGGTENNSSSKSGSSKSSSSSGGGSASDPYRVKGFPVGKNKGADGPSESASGGMVPLSQTRYFKGGASGSEVASNRSADVVGITGLGGREKEKLDKSDEKIFNAGSLGDAASSKNKKLELKDPERKIASEEKDSPWSFSSYLKFAVILMIIIAIVLFLGGQMLQISKSMEK